MVICKESSKPSKLSTKLSTIWQINDYLSKKIDNRLIVDIIDTRGHPVFGGCFEGIQKDLLFWQVLGGAKVILILTFFTI